MKIFVDSPLWTKHEYTVAGLAGHFLGIDYKAPCLRNHRCSYFTENVHTSVWVTVYASSPRPMPETLVVVITRSAAWHCLTLR